MKQQAGDGPGLDALVSDASDAPFEVADLVVPPQQRMAMPVQRLEAVTLRRLFAEPARLAPARIAAGPSAPAANANDR